MNSKLEACRTCPQQCVLEDKAQMIVDRIKTGDISLDRAAGQISIFSQQATKAFGNEAAKPCPNVEINRARLAVAEQTGNWELIRREKRNLNFTSSVTPRRDWTNPDHNPSLQRPRLLRRD